MIRSSKHEVLCKCMQEIPFTQNIISTKYVLSEMAWLGLNIKNVALLHQQDVKRF